MRNKIIITDKSSYQLEVIIRAKRMFLRKNEVTQGNMFETGYIKVDFLKKGNSVLRFEKFFLTVCNFKSQEKKRWGLVFKMDFEIF